MLLISQDYKAGILPKEIIRQLEKTNNCSIEELVARIDKLFDDKKHHLKTMTITDMRKWLKKKKVSDEEKKRYAEVNHCTYEEAVEKAKERLEAYDAQKEFEHLDRVFGLTEETRMQIRKANQELVDQGYAEKSPDGAYVIQGDNFVRFIKDKFGKI